MYNVPLEIEVKWYYREWKIMQQWYFNSLPMLTWKHWNKNQSTLIVA